MGLPLSFAASSAFAPDGELSHRVLVLAGGLADDEGDVPRGHVLLELLRQQPLQRLIGAEGLAVFPDAAEPVGLGV